MQDADDIFNTNSFQELFSQEMDLLRQSLEMSRGGDIFIIEYSHKEVLRNGAFFLVHKLKGLGLSLHEIVLNPATPFPMLDNMNGFAFFTFLLKALPIRRRCHFQRILQRE
ncbi:hypothetical protein JXJ21_25865 [candidate division KSB1 bacterium]|nr:hypothetical protein [candidate division KSB1 bacterium]